MNVIEAILSRRSIRKYTGEEIPEKALHSILEAGLLAPSSRNLRPAELVVVREKEVIRQLARVKTAGSGMLKNASCAVVVIGNSEKSDAWIEDCSVAMTYMMLRATELGIASCWVQCRNRISQQRAGQALSDFAEDVAQSDSAVPSEKLVAQRIADSEKDKDNLSSDEFLKLLLNIPDKYSALAIMSLGISDSIPAPRSREAADFSKVHEGKMTI